MTAKTLYFQSKYSQAAKAKYTLADLPYIIGAMVFTAQHAEARHLYESRKTELNQDELIICGFHIGISYTRTSEYKEAKGVFLKNLKILRTHKLTLKPISKFYAHQGIAFYRFYFSLNLKSQIHAHRGYKVLLSTKNSKPLLKVLSMDLQGHNLVQLGQVNRGLVFFEKAIQTSSENKLLDLKKEINISYQQYLSAHDDKPDLYIDKFLKFLNDQTYQNDYTKSNLVLQTAKLYVLKGEFDKANSFLREHYDTIYRKQDKRKVAILNTILAQLMMYRGQFLESISVIQAALNFLSPDVDKVLMLPLLGLKLTASLNLGRDDLELRKKIANLNSKVDHLISKKIQNREIGNLKTYEIGEDKLGDLIDKASKKHSDAIKEIINTNYLSLIFKYFNLKLGGKYIILCQNPETTITVGHDSITETKETLTKTQMSLLYQLSQSNGLSKEEIITSIWGYKYDSIRHDSIIYSNVARLKKSLLDKGKWIYSDENKYYLAPEIEVLHQFKPEDQLVKTKSKLKKNLYTEELNYRQIQLIENQSINVFSASEYGESHNITRMTANRDLKELVNKGLLNKNGKGRATRYFK